MYTSVNLMDHHHTREITAITYQIMTSVHIIYTHISNIYRHQEIKYTDTSINQFIYTYKVYIYIYI